MQIASIKFISVCLISVAAAAASVASRAETYEGVHHGGAALARADVAPDALATARAGNIYSDTDAMGVADPMRSGLSRSDVRSTAIATARDGDPYAEGASAGPVAEIFEADHARSARLDRQLERAADVASN